MQMEVEVNLILLFGGILVGCVGLLGTLVGYFIKAWKASVDSSLTKLKTEAIEYRINMVDEFVRKEDCRVQEKTTYEDIKNLYEKIDELLEKLEAQHSKFMYELGKRNGIKRDLLE